MGFISSNWGISTEWLVAWEEVGLGELLLLVSARDIVDDVTTIDEGVGSDDGV